MRLTIPWARMDNVNTIASTFFTETKIYNVGQLYVTIIIMDANRIIAYSQGDAHKCSKHAQTHTHAALPPPRSS